MLSNKTYDALKWVAQILLPGLGALYFGLGQVWGFPNVEEVVGTITLIDIFLGGLLGFSSASYKKSDDYRDGSLTQVGSDPDTGMPHLAMTLNKTPDELMGKETVRLEVEPTKE